jgi:hypothetical protein
MREIEIEWHPLGITVTAQLIDQPNRNLSDLLWERLPYNALQNHALVSGDHLYHLVPIPELLYTAADFKEDRTQSADGTLFLSQLQHLAIKYGVLSEYIPAAPIGYVRDADLPLLKEVGRACWHATSQSKQVIEARVRRKGTQVTDYPLPVFRCSGHPELSDLVDAIQRETEKIWITPPAELADLHNGIILSGAGSYGQYFSTLVFLNGETRPLGYCALNGLVRLAANDNISLETLREITPNFIRTTAEFLGYCGLNTLWRFTQELIQRLRLIENKGQYLALLGSLALYTNVLNTWNLQLFPWQHGQAYPQLRPSALRDAG